MTEREPTAFWLWWMDDPLALAGTGRRVGTLQDCKELALDRYAHARFEGPYLDIGAKSKIYVQVEKNCVGIIKEFPADFEEKARNKIVASRVDDVRAGKLSREDYQRLLQEDIAREWAGL